MEKKRSIYDESILPKSMYLNDQYFSFIQIMSFIEQIWLVRELKPATVLEIGIGNGFVSNYLKSIGISVLTYDINPNLEPDIVGSIDDLGKHFQDRTFDMVLCAEVLEHTEFENFEKYIQNISKISTHAIITIPRAQKLFLNFQWYIQLPFVGSKLLGFSLARRTFHISKSHQWEIDSSLNTSMNQIKKIISKYFTIVRYGKMRFASYQLYFILRRI
ncbi:MAG: class I SAM-dependent methyltransferase [Candidatus Omnitrophica bacterium]|nr:class I SAM-dependent methyltransferase [Candidatus Omnitrophota bacterium]